LRAAAPANAEIGDRISRRRTPALARVYSKPTGATVTDLTISTGINAEFSTVATKNRALRPAGLGARCDALRPVAALRLFT
jgi:hypothetical protein